MPIPSSMSGRFAYHFTLFDNLESIIDSGIMCTNLKKKRGVNHISIAEESIQSRRSTMSIPHAPGKVVHDYVPFYFSKKTSMQLGVINKKNIDQPLLLYFAIPIEAVCNIPDTVFSDASANTDVPPNFYNSSDADKLHGLNWEAIDSKKWGCPSDEFRHQKMAELLLPERVGLDQISYIVVWNDWIKEEVGKVFAKKGITPPAIRFDDEHYYLNFYEGGRKSIVTGPRFLKHLFEEAVDYIKSNQRTDPTYTGLTQALTAIVSDFCTIKELADIEGLKASYPPHFDEVGVHSRKVVNALTSIQEYINLSQHDKDLVRLAAYFHDIGKGPKSRWKVCEMERADNDHAVKSLPMLQRILTEEIGNLTAEDIRKVVMLVTYDDLIGDIVAKDRDEKQLTEIVTSENDINMLIALSKADMQSINAVWPIIHAPEINLLKNRTIKAITIPAP